MNWNQSPRRKPRLVISFSGLDGAGKTRQIDALVRDLERRGRTEVLWIPFKMWPERLVSRLPLSFRNSVGPNRSQRLHGQPSFSELAILGPIDLHACPCARLAGFGVSPLEGKAEQARSPSKEWS